MSFIPYCHTIRGKFSRRLNRFVAEVCVSGEVVSVHVPSSGRMTDILAPGAEVLLRPAPVHSKRATRFTLLAVRWDDLYISVDASLPNRLFREIFATAGLHELKGWLLERSEYTMGESRFDFLLRRNDLLCPVEVKSVTHVDQTDGAARFPDAPTVRGKRHVRHLTSLVAAGGSAAIIFVVQRNDARYFSPYAQIDPGFAAELREAQRQGVTILAYRCEVSPEGVRLTKPIPIVI